MEVHTLRKMRQCLVIYTTVFTLPSSLGKLTNNIFSMLMLDILIISLFCCGLHFITRDGWLLDFIDYALLGALGGSIRYGVDRSITWKNKWGEYAYKPLLGCVVCMGSV